VDNVADNSVLAVCRLADIVGVAVAITAEETIKLGDGSRVCVAAAIESTGASARRGRISCCATKIAAPGCCC
jgi:hypothetical protein